MGIQKKILTRLETISVKKQERNTDGSLKPEATEDLKSELGTLALGKPGDVIATAYGPVTKAYTIPLKDGAAQEIAFGSFIEGEGILVNSDDVAGIGSTAKPFDTKTAKSGQVVSVLVSGGAVVPKGASDANLNAIKAGMNVIETITETVATEDDKVVGVIVNGLKA